MALCTENYNGVGGKRMRCPLDGYCANVKFRTQAAPCDDWGTDPWPHETARLEAQRLAGECKADNPIPRVDDFMMGDPIDETQLPNPPLSERGFGSL